jgi:hypothetical protein
MRNLATGALKLGGVGNIVAASRYHARDATRTLATLGLIPPWPKRTSGHYAEALRFHAGRSGRGG